MAKYSIELTGITKNPNGSVNVDFSQKVDDIEVGSGGIQYGSLADLRSAIATLHEQLLNSTIGPLILAARAQAINADFDNINPLLNKELIFDPNAIQVVRFQ